MTDLALKWVRLAPKGTDQILVHYGSPIQSEENFPDIHIDNHVDIQSTELLQSGFPYHMRYYRVNPVVMRDLKSCVPSY